MNYRYIFISLFILAILPFGNDRTYAQDLSPETIVATVNGKPILYKRISIKNNVADRVFKHKYSRSPQSDDDRKKVKQIKRKKEIEWLADAIKTSIHYEIQLKNHITVSSQELKDKWEETYQDNEFEKSMRETRKKSETTLLAVEAVLRKKMSAEQAYQKFLKKSKDVRNMSEWKNYLKNFKSLEYLAGLKKILNMNANELAEEFSSSMEGWVIEDKLNLIIDKELAATDPEVAELYSIHEKIKIFKKKYKKLNSKVPFGDRLMDQKRGMWWRGKYRKADIKILIPEFSLAKKYILGDPEAWKFIHSIP